MIQINLLPEEYRRRARTPVKLLLTVSGFVAVAASLLAYWVWLAFGVAAEIETQRSVAQLELDGLTPQVNYHKSLDGEIKVYASQERTLSDITAQRVLWTRKVDELIDVVNSGDEGVRHYIWFDDLSVTQKQDSRTNTYGDFKASGHSGSAKWDQVANFLEDLADPELTAFIHDFHSPDWPEGQQSTKDDTLIPSEVWAFPLSMTLKSPDERAASEKAAVKKPEEARQ